MEIILKQGSRIPLFYQFQGNYNHSKQHAIIKD